MKKRNGNEVDEFLRRLEEAFNNMADGADNAEKRQIFVDISVNIWPFIIPRINEPGVKVEEKTPVDIIETEKTIHVVVALPEVDRESIELSCDGMVLGITANNPAKDFNETIDLPARVNKTGMKATYKKGILEVVFNKSRKKVLLKK